ncbi:hypothetical protein DKX38_018526 [Salix brachista]|uniref:Single-stranded DNA-binding protein n=1 Tax=Salix brachista TaxID=2182728 RepID=A0A5N5KP15_9ROSI|nr:hypothetical protein DKX38_018526 [Salix brachista]
MANSMAVLPRRLYRSLLSSNLKISPLSMPFCSSSSSSSTTTNNLSSREEDSGLNDSDTHSVLNSTTSSSPPSSTTPEGSSGSRMFQDRPLENGLDVGIYKAILVGQVGQNPLQKKLRSGREITMFSLGTGGIRNNRRPLQNEDPREYANRCAVQWHRVSVYPERLGRVVMQNVVPGDEKRPVDTNKGNKDGELFEFWDLATSYDPITGKDIIVVLATEHEMILEVKVLEGRLGTIHLGMVIEPWKFYELDGIIFLPLWFEVQWCRFLEEYENSFCALQKPSHLGITISYLNCSILYVEGNLESKVFTDPITGLVRRIREIAVRQNGRLVFLGKGANDQQASSSEMKGLGYY